MQPQKSHPPSESLLDLLEERLRAPVESKRRWIDRQDAAVREQLMEVKRRWQAGQYSGTTAYILASRLREAVGQMGVTRLPSVTTLCNWLTDS